MSNHHLVYAQRLRQPTLGKTEDAKLAWPAYAASPRRALSLSAKTTCQDVAETLACFDPPANQRQILVNNFAWLDASLRSFDPRLAGRLFPCRREIPKGVQPWAALH